MVRFYKLKSFLEFNNGLFPRKNGLGASLDHKGSFHIWFQTNVNHYHLSVGEESNLTMMLDIQETLEKNLYTPKYFNNNVPGDDGFWSYGVNGWIRVFDLTKPQIHIPA